MKLEKTNANYAAKTSEIYKVLNERLLNSKNVMNDFVTKPMQFYIHSFSSSTITYASANNVINC